MADEVIHQQAPEVGQLRTGTDEGDTALVAAVLHKDRKATADFVARFADDVYAYLRSRLAPHYDRVDDLAQEVFVATWRSLPQYRGEGTLRAWIGSIARHKVEDYYRQSLRAPLYLEDVDPGAEKIQPSFDFQDIVERDELRSATLRVLQELPERYRIVLIWRYWERATTNEMSLKTGKTEKAIERLLARAREEFRQRWKSGRA